YRNQLTNEAVLPSQGGWELLPQPIAGLPKEVRYLGHRYTREMLRQEVPVLPPANAEVVDYGPICLWALPATAGKRTRPGATTALTTNSSDSRVKITARCAMPESHALRWTPNSGNGQTNSASTIGGQG